VLLDCDLAAQRVLLGTGEKIEVTDTASRTVRPQ